MISRSTVIAALVVIQLAIIGEAIVAIRSGGPTHSIAEAAIGHAPPGPHLIEDGPHRLFDVGPHPAVTVDIGYADLTIETGKASQIDASLSASSAFGGMRETGPISARADGETVRIAETEARDWSVGDDRMVTLIVPPDTTVNVRRAGDIDATGLRADGSFHSVGKGTITIEDYDAPTLRASSSGRITLRTVAATRIDATSDDDRVEGSALLLRDGRIESSDGMTLDFVTRADTLVRAEAKDGKISVTGGTADATATTAPKSDDNDDDSSRRTARFGTGNGHLDVSAGDGDIELVQES